MSLLYQNDNYFIISSYSPEASFELDYIIDNINNRTDYDNLIKESFEYANNKLYDCNYDEKLPSKNI